MTSRGAPLLVFTRRARIVLVTLWRLRIFFTSLRSFRRSCFGFCISERSTPRRSFCALRSRLTRSLRFSASIRIGRLARSICRQRHPYRPAMIIASVPKMPSHTPVAVRPEGASGRTEASCVYQKAHAIATSTAIDTTRNLRALTRLLPSGNDAIQLVGPQALDRPRGTVAHAGGEQMSLVEIALHGDALELRPLVRRFRHVGAAPAVAAQHDVDQRGHRRPIDLVGVDHR